MPIVQRGRGALVPELSARHSEGQGSSQGQGNYQRQGGPFGDRGLQGCGGPMPVHPAGRGHGSWASAVSGSAANVLVPQQQVAAQATPYDPVIIGRLLNALSGPAPNVLMPQPQAAVSGMLYSPIPVGHWAIISLGPVPEGFQTPDVWLALYPQVIAARTECKKGKVSIQLLFKQSRPRDELKVTLEGWAATRAAKVTTVTIDASHAPSERYTGLRDLEYIDQVYAHARSQQELDNLLAIAPPLIKDKDSRSRYGEYFLNYDQYPPIIGPLIPRDQRLRRLQVVEFDTACNHVMSVGFVTMMWPTSGPVDAIIRRICQLVNEGRSTTWAPNLLPDESFGFAKSPPVWCIKLDLNLEHPKYSKPAESSASKVNTIYGVKFIPIQLQCYLASASVKSLNTYTTRIVEEVLSLALECFLGYVLDPLLYCLIMMNGRWTRSNPTLITQSPEPEVSLKLSTLRSHHSNTRSTKALASKSRTKAPPKIGPKSRVPQKTCSIDPPETSSESDEEDADPPTTLKDPKSRARIGAGPAGASGGIQFAPPPSFSSPRLTTQTALDNTCNMDPDHVDDNEGMHLDLDAKAKEWKRSPESIRRIALAAALSKFQRNGNAWNAFQSSYRQSNPNLNSSVSASEYTSNVVRLAYLSLSSLLEARTLILGQQKPQGSSRNMMSGGDMLGLCLPQKEKLDTFAPSALVLITTFDHSDCSRQILVTWIPIMLMIMRHAPWGGQFSAKQVAWAQNRCIEFLVDLDAKAKEWKRSPESVRRIALAAAPSKFQQNGNAWNAFQSSYRQSNPNLNSSVMWFAAYLKLIESFGGEDSDTWAAEATRLIGNMMIAQSGGDIARIMSAQKEKWTHDMQWLATMDVHAMFIMVSSNAASPAAHAQNECRLGSIEMSEWFNAKFSMAAEISDIYCFILSKCSQHEALREFTAEESQKKRAFDLSNVYKTRTAIKGMLAALFRPYVEFSVFPWTNLAKILIEHKLVLRNFLPNAQFPNFGSEYSDHYGTSHWKALYFTLQDTNPERKVTLSSLDDWPEGDASDIPLIVDHNGDVILSLKGARDAASKKVAGGSSGGGAKRRNASDSLVDGGVTKKIRELSSDLRKGTKRAKGKRKSTPLSSAYINSESDNAVESDPSGPSKVHLGNELQPQPKPRPRFSNSQASPSVSGVTSAPPPPLIDLPRTDWRGVDLSYFDPTSFDNTFNAYPGSVNGTMDHNADMILLRQTSTLQHGDYPGTAQPDDLFGFSMGHQQGHVEIGMHDFGGPSTMSDGLNYENGVAHNSMDVTWGLDSLGLSTSFQQLVHVAGMKFRDWGPIGAQLGLADMGYLAQLGPMLGGPP
ncbi:hypothetical protein BS47DRAFT_1368401 [Hydnum rufescens UP504]|uniref:Uncharacterized protein n=1 Tax=Hydnum rufescens UP504 TaxID=1448309 RepID=A0A9P6AFX2_9AGAM|nr:hypothetical protein BS47DRAFT_1368401 [Hydnum rufescens UP504]